MLTPEIEVKNATKWAWKQGITLTLDDNCDLDQLPIEPVQQEIEFKVKEEETFKLVVVMGIKEFAKVSDKVHEFNLTFRGPGGNPFGDPIPMKVKVTGQAQPISYEMEIKRTKLAIKLFDQKLGKSFEDCQQAAEQADGNEQKAIELLTKKN